MDGEGERAGYDELALVTIIRCRQAAVFILHAMCASHASSALWAAQA
jgi:hypothetical protein